MTVQRFRLIALVWLCFAGLPMAAFQAAKAEDLITADPAITPLEVVSIQLSALQANDDPSVDHGIRQTWAFAHPDNRRVTGPLARFASMMRSPAYEMLINHRQHTITPWNEARDWVEFKVLIEDSRGRALSFYWVVKKVDEGEFTGSWMTSAVSAPSLVGQGS